MVIISVGKHVADRLRFVYGLLIAEAVTRGDCLRRCCSLPKFIAVRLGSATLFLHGSG
jgi:hypothetical protein